MAKFKIGDAVLVNAVEAGEAYTVVGIHGDQVTVENLGHTESYTYKTEDLRKAP